MVYHLLAQVYKCSANKISNISKLRLLSYERKASVIIGRFNFSKSAHENWAQRHTIKLWRTILENPFCKYYAFCTTQNLHTKRVPPNTHLPFFLQKRWAQITRLLETKQRLLQVEGLMIETIIINKICNTHEHHFSHHLSNARNVNL